MFGLVQVEPKQLARCDNKNKHLRSLQYNTFIVNIFYLHNNQHHIINIFRYFHFLFFTVNSISVQMYTKVIQASQVPQKSNSCTVLKHNQILEGHAHACT